jgi:hypothetical protein
MTSFVAVAACSSDSSSTTTTQPDASAQDSAVADSGGADTGSHDSAMPDASADTSTDSPMEAMAPWDPSKLGTALVTWLDAGQGVVLAGASVNEWLDQSPPCKANMSACANAGPVGAAPTQVMGVVHGHPVIRFDGTSDQYLTIGDTASLQWGVGDFAVFAVVSYTNTASTNSNTGYGTIWGKVDNNGLGFILFGNDGGAGTGAIRAQFSASFYATSAGQNYNSGAFHYIGGLRYGNALWVRADGTSVQTTSASGTDVSTTGSAVYIGARNNNTQMLKGDIAEILAVKGTVTATDISNIETYLKTKYGL